MGLSGGNITVARSWPLMMLGDFETALLSGLKAPSPRSSPIFPQLAQH